MAPIIPIRLLTAAQARREASRLRDNIGRRAARLEAQGLQTNAVAEFRALQAAGAPQTRNEAVSQVSALRRLDSAAGLRSRTAEGTYRREARRRSRDELADRSRNIDSLSRLSESDMRQALSIRTERLRGARRRVRDALGTNPDGSFRETHATLRLQEVLDDIQRNPSRRQMMSALARLNKVESFEGITVAGARRQAQQGRKIFGDAYDTWSDRERGFVWDEVHRMVDGGFVNGSAMAVDIVSAYVKSDKVAVTFKDTATDSEGNTYKLERPVVGFGFDGAEAERDAIIKQANIAAIRKMRRANNPLGPIRLPR